MGIYAILGINNILLNCKHEKTGIKRVLLYLSIQNLILPYPITDPYRSNTDLFILKVTHPDFEVNN